MYNEYFGFKESPFSIAPDPRYLYMTAQHREALAHLVYGLNSEGGCILLTGEVGTGKTTICRCLLEQIPAEANVALVLNPKVNEIELLETICDELKIPYPDKEKSDTSNSVKTYTDRIYNFLIENNRKNESTVLIIDEAQNLDSTVLEQLRLLTNLETDKRKLLQIIILGQPELLDILAKTEMRQLAQRITARYHLEPLSKPNIKAYVDHRLAIAGQNIKIFPEKSINLLYKLSKGIPRLINVICDRALLGAYVENQYTVSPQILKKAAKEVFGELKNVESRQNNMRWFAPTAIITGFTALSILLFFNVKQPAIDFSKKLLPANANQNTKDRDKKASNDTTSSIASGVFDTNNNSSFNGNKKVIEQGVNNNSGKTDHDNLSIGSTTEDISHHKANKQNLLQPNNIQTIKDFESSLNTSSNSLSSSYDILFNLWGGKYNRRSNTTGCKQAESFSLLCLHRLGNLNSLKKLNRPAALKIINPKGEHRYIAVTKIRNDIVTVYSGGKPFAITLTQLDQYWHGQFILLWKRPNEYNAPIKPGERSGIVNWLHSLFDDPGKPIADNLYSNALSTKVRAFQKEHHLTADGIVGPVTIIHLNTQSNQKIPILIEK